MTMLKKIFAAAFALAIGGTAQAGEVTVKMVNSGPGGQNVFDPAFVAIAPGDTVKFVASDKSHSVETIKGMAPDGAPEVKGKIGQDQSVTFDKEGVYGFKCLPHFAMGMVAVVAVGKKLENLDQAKGVDVPKAVHARLDPLLAKAAETKGN